MDRQTAPIPALGRRAALVGAAQALVLLAAACVSPQTNPAPAAQDQADPTAEPVAAATTDPACAAALPPVIRPTPIPYPGYVGVEPSTGLHVTAPPQVLELASYRLAVTGKAARALSLTYDELRCLPRVAAHVRIVCPGFFVDESNLAGASLASVLALAEPLEGAARVEFIGIDGRTNSASLDAMQSAENFLAYEWEGEPLPVSHGFPIRAALPNNTGGDWVKWLVEIRIS